VKKYFQVFYILLLFSLSVCFLLKGFGYAPSLLLISVLFCLWSIFAFALYRSFLSFFSLLLGLAFFLLVVFK